MGLLKNNRTVLYILLYYLIAMVLRYYLVIIKPDFFISLNTHLQSLLSGISPLIGGLILVKTLKRPNNLTLFSIGFWKTIFVVTLPILLFFIIGSFNLGKPNYAIALSIVVSILYAIFEEYGWRGYLQSELSEVSAIYKYIIISVLWYFWHLDFGLDLQHLLSYFFVLMGSVGIGYVADKSKSLILPSLFHMFFNILFTNSLVGISFSQKVILLSVCTISVVFVMWLRLENRRTKIN
jgi:membrane protease YdiL (CAAX protease family)